MILVGLLGLAAATAPISDVRVGDDGDTARVEVICSRSCDAEPIDEYRFQILSARADFTADVRSQSAHLERITLKSNRAGTVMEVTSRSGAVSVMANRCGANRLCFDFDFAQKNVPSAPATVESVGAELDQLLYRTKLNDVSPEAVMAVAESNAGCRAAEKAFARDAFNLFAFRTVAFCRAKPADTQASLSTNVSLGTLVARNAGTAGGSPYHSALR